MLLPSFSSAALPLLLLPLSVSAGYFTDGFKQGDIAKKFSGSGSKQAASFSRPPQPASGLPPRNPVDAAKRIGEGFLDAINQALYQGVGIDLKGIMTNATAAKVFTQEEDDKDGVVRLTDFNYDDVITYEDVEEGTERLWCILVHGAKAEPLTPLFWNAHAIAANTTKALAANNSDPLDMSHVRFGRVDYMNVTEITTRWLMFKPPYLVFATQRGQELRFLAPRNIRPEGNLLRKAIASGAWREPPVWTSRFAPSGPFGWYIAKLGQGLRIWNEKTANIPRFAWLMISGVISQTLLTWMHSVGGDKKKAEPKKQVPAVAVSGSDKAKAIAEQIRAKAAAKKEAEKVELQTQEAARVLAESEARKSSVTATAAGRKKGSAKA